MTARILAAMVVLLLTACGVAQALPQCVSQYGQVTTTINGVQITTPGNNGVTQACTNCCDRIVVTAPSGASVNIKWAAAWTYTGATAPDGGYCSSPSGALFYYPPSVLPWLQHTADREVYADFDETTTSSGAPITVNICHPAGDWKSPEAHIDFLVNVTSAGGAPSDLVSNFSGTGGWDPECRERGCTPGYWKNHTEAWPVATTTTFNEVFGEIPSGSCQKEGIGITLTLLQGLNLGGGGQCALIRHAVSAYLNSLAIPLCGQQPFLNLGYSYSTSQILQMVTSAYDSGDFENFQRLFAAANESMCTEPSWGGPNSCTPASFCEYWLSTGVPLF